jgi:TolB-like protein
MRGFIEELKYRNVFRVAIAYIVVGWLVAQVADLVVDAFNLPDSFLQMIIVLLVLGFPIAVVFAWAFELTSDGVKRARDLPADTPKDPRSGRFLNRVTIVTLVIAVAWLGWDKLQRGDAVPAPTQAAVIDKSIAVLPFADFSADADHAWFADGLTDEILNALARIRDLRVASRSSAFQYREAAQDIPKVAAELGVAHILEGSVRRAGDRIRVTAQLIRAADDAHLWSETYDASSDDSIAIQESIAFEIASVLDTAMDPEELRRMVEAGTDSIPAWETYLRLLDIANVALGEQDSSRNEEVFALYDATIALDPAFAEAHVVMADTLYSWLNPSDFRTPPPGYSTADLKTRFREAARLAARHARTEPTRLRAEILRAVIEVQLDRLVELTRGRLSLLPNDNFAWYEHIEALVQASRFDEARDVSARFLEARPDNTENLGQLVVSLARVHLDGGLMLTDEMLATPDPNSGTLYQAHRILLYADRIDEARELAERYLGLATDPMLVFLIRLRQACAEGRVDDAQALYDAFDFEATGDATNTRWLSLKTLGRNEDAAAALQPLDSPATLHALAGHLTYVHFDPRAFRNLSTVLELQGVMRDEPIPLNFACKR